MYPLRFPLAVSVALVSLFSTKLHAEVIIENFAYWTPSSSYGSWAPESSARFESGADSWEISSTDFGGAYRYLGSSGSVANIEAMNSLELDIYVESQSNGNAGIGVLVFLEDRDGTVYKYSHFGNREGAHSIVWDLKSPRSTGNEGSVPGFNFSDVQAINVMVDPGGANSYTVSFGALRAIAAISSPPTESAPTSAAYIMKQGFAYVDEPGNPRYERCILDYYYPTDSEDFATVVFFHAGGLRAGGRYIPGELREKGIAVIAADYSLYPNADSPDFIEDAAAAVAWAFANVEELGGSKDKIFVAGASAGGYLSMMLGLDESWLGRHDIDANDLAGIISLSGQTITHVAVREEMGGDRLTPVVDGLAPLNHVRGDAPPLLLVTGDRELELLGRYEENAFMKRMMQLNGHTQTELYEIEGKDHGGVERPGHEFLLKFVQEIAP